MRTLTATAARTLATRWASRLNGARCAAIHAGRRTLSCGCGAAVRVGRRALLCNGSGALFRGGRSAALHVSRIALLCVHYLWPLSNQPVSWFNRVAPWNRNIVSRYNDVLSWNDSVVSRNNDVVSRAYTLAITYPLFANRTHGSLHFLDAACVY